MFKTVFDATLWPEGISVNKYYSRYTNTIINTVFILWVLQIISHFAHIIFEGLIPRKLIISITY